MREPRVLVFDIETTPFIGYTWGKWNVNVIQFVEDWHVLCFAYKWLGEDDIHVVAQPDFARDYRRNRRNDFKVVRELWKLLNEADVVIAHNGDKFDIKKVNARFAVHKLGRPAPFISIDTLKVARRNFAFGSNSLNDLGKFLDLGHKLPHTGFDLWLGCMAGNPESWKLMKRYNVQDVRLLEALYYRLRDEGWIVNHPNMALHAGVEHLCPVCLSDDLQRRGLKYSKSLTYQQWQCNNCGSYSRSRSSEPTRTDLVQ